jgi:hypothetical protein
MLRGHPAVDMICHFELHRATSELSGEIMDLSLKQPTPTIRKFFQSANSLFAPANPHFGDGSTWGPSPQSFPVSSVQETHDQSSIEISSKTITWTEEPIEAPEFLAILVYSVCAQSHPVCL